MRNYLIIIIATLLLIACSANIKEEFDSGFSKYNDLVASNDLSASSLFVADSARDSYLKSVDAAKDMRIFEYRIITKTVDELKRKATVNVEVDYYMLNANKVKKMRYIQEWSYIEGKDFKDWRLLTPLPLFK
jgi:hypothetical protein